MLVGILSLMAACVCWSLVFVIPLILESYSPIEIALGRFFCYGLISFLILLTTKRKLLSKKFRPYWLKATGYGFASTLLCFTSMVFSIRFANSAVTALIYSFTPLTIALYGNWKNKQYSYKRLFLPLVIMMGGIVLANLNAFETKNDGLFTYLLGLGSGFLGVFSWTWYAVANSEFLSKQTHMTTQEWGLMMGAAMFFLVIMVSGLLAPHLSWNWSMHYVIGSAILGVVGTWLAFLFWNFGSKRVPIALAGQMMMLEVVFGVTLVYSYYNKLPETFELLGMLLMGLGVLISYKLLKPTTSHA